MYAFACLMGGGNFQPKMNHLIKHLSAPLAFVTAFLLFGAPSAPGVTFVPTLSGEALSATFLAGPIPLDQVDSDGDGWPDDTDPCPFDPTNNCNAPPPPTDFCQTLATLSLASGTYATMVGISVLFAPPPVNGMLTAVAIGAGVVSVVAGFGSVICEAVT